MTRDSKGRYYLTDEELQTLYKIFNASNAEWQPANWKPEEGDNYFYCGFDSNTMKFIPINVEHMGCMADLSNTSNGNYYKTYDDCLTACNEYNKAIQEVKTSGQ